MTRHSPKLIWCGVHLVALWTIVLVQPLFDLIGKNATFFVARDSTPGDVLILAFGWTLVPPLVAFAVVALVRLVSARAAAVVHWGFVTLLAGVLVLQVIKGVSADAAVVVPLALVIAAGLTFAYARFEGLRSFVSLLGIAPVVVLALFLVVSPGVREIVFPPDPPPAPAGKAQAHPTPVVVMIFDELPATTLMTADKQVDGKRYPNFAKLEKTSTWYRNASSVADGTYVAVPAILTGDRPKEVLPTNRAYPDNIYNVLGKQTEFHNAEPMTILCPVSLCGERFKEPQGRRLSGMFDDLSIVERRLLLPTGMASTLPPIDRDWEDFRADANRDDLAKLARQVTPVDRFDPKEPLRAAGTDLPAQRVKLGLRNIATMKPTAGKPGFWMTHFVTPHVPWRFLPDGRQYPVAGESIPGLEDQDWGDNQFLVDQGYQRHVLSTRFADRLLGRAIDHLQRSGLWDKALFIVVADHGVALEPGESRRPVTKTNFAETASVPMFVKMPGQGRGAVDEKLTTTLDVVPTIIKTLGIKTDKQYDGVPVDEPRRARTITQRNGREGKLVTVPARTFLDQLDEVVRKRSARFPEGLASLADIGPRSDLVGKPVSSLQLVDRGEASAFINYRTLYSHVRRKSGILPVYLTGTTTDIAPRTELVAALNGRIVASGEAYDLGESHRFSMLLPQRSLTAGGNHLAVIAVDGDEGRVLAGRP